jgi:hypothetical protein
VNGVDLAGCDQDTAYDLVIAVASGEESDIGGDRRPVAGSVTSVPSTGDPASCAR